MSRTHRLTGGTARTPERRTLGGSILFVGVAIAILLAASHPGIAAAAALGAVSALLAERVAGS